MDLKLETNADLDGTTFRARYLEPERPVLVRGVDLKGWSALDVAAIKARFAIETHRKPGWFDATITRDLPIPSIVKAALTHERLAWRARPMRVWLQPGGHRTFFHYDGNSVHGFNLQVTGRKRWRLISPHTPPPMVPFQFVAMIASGSASWALYEFETEPGDLLFLPRYWCHEVEALEPLNFNVNWVCTPHDPASSPIGWRERELLRLRLMLPMLECCFSGTLDDYGADGETIVSTYTAGISRSRALWRLMGEMSNLPLTIWRARDLLRRIRVFKSNNFRVDDTPHRTRRKTAEQGFTRSQVQQRIRG